MHYFEESVKADDDDCRHHALERIEWCMVETRDLNPCPVGRSAPSSRGLFPRIARDDIRYLAVLIFALAAPFTIWGSTSPAPPSESRVQIDSITDPGGDGGI